MPQDLLTVTRPELLEKGSDRSFRALLYDFFAFGSSLEATRSKFAEYADLSTAQYLILIAIAQAPQHEGVGYVARHLHLSSAFVTIELNRLVAEKLVSKLPHHDDGRRVRLAITPQGSALLAHLAALQRPVNDMLFETLTAEEFRILSRIMRRLADGGASAVDLATHLKSRMANGNDYLGARTSKETTRIRKLPTTKGRKPRKSGT